MIQRHTLSVPRRPIDPDAVGYFRFGPFDGHDGEQVVLTNEYGEWHLLDPDAFQAMLSGTLEEDHAARPALAAKGFLKPGVDAEALAAAMRRRKKSVGVGPSHHHLALSGPGGAMSVELLKSIVDHAMLSTATALTLVLHADTVDLDLLGFTHQYCTEKNRYEGKTLRWILATDLAGLDGAAATWLADHRFTVRAPLASHEAAEALAGAAATLIEAGTARRRGAEILELEVPLTASGLDAHALVAAVASLGARRFRLVPQWRGADAIAPADAARVFDTVLTACLDHGEVVEETIASLVHAATSTDAGDDPALNSPALSALAYDADGRILAGPAAFGADGDDMVLGTAGVASYKDVVHHPLRRALALASLVECLPGLSDHWAAPLVGVDPVATFQATGDVFPRPPAQPEVQGGIAVAARVVRWLSSPKVDRVEALRAWPR